MLTISQDGIGADLSIEQHNNSVFKPGTELILIGEITGAIIPPSNGDRDRWITYRGDSLISHNLSTLSREAFSLNASKYINIRGLNFNGNFIAERGIAGRDACSNILIENCTFANYEKYGIQLSALTDGSYYGEDVLINRCNFDDIGNHGDTAPADINITTWYRRVTITNTIHNATIEKRGVDGITFAQDMVISGTGHIISGCKFYGDYEENFIDLKGVAPGASGETKTRIENCIGTGGVTGETQAIHVHLDTTDIDIVNNEFSDCSNGVVLVKHDWGQNNVGRIAVIDNKFMRLRKGAYWELQLEEDGLGGNSFIGNVCEDIGIDNSTSHSIEIHHLNGIIRDNTFVRLSSGNSPEHLNIRINGSSEVFNTLELDGNRYQHILRTADAKLLVNVSERSREYTIDDLRAESREINGCICL